MDVAGTVFSQGRRSLRRRWLALSKTTARRARAARVRGSARVERVVPATPGRPDE